MQSIDPAHSLFALDILGLKKNFANSAALKGVDLRVSEGDFFALLGPNGAGKSTTIGIICSLIRKTAGAVRVFGHDIDVDFSKAKQCLGVVPQEFNFNVFEKTRDIVINQGGYYGLPRAQAEKNADRYLKALGLWDKKDAPSRSLSGGMKRRLMIARALVHEPRLLILDEPTAGVDIELRRSMWAFLQEMNAQGTTIILTTHYLEEAEQLCRNIAIIDRGEIVENTSVKKLLSTLSRETFVLDVASLPHNALELPGYQFSLGEDLSLEVSVEKVQSLNELFVLLERQNVSVMSMRNKTNRLEELFVSLIRGHEASSSKKSGGNV